MAKTDHQIETVATLKQLRM